MGSVRGVWLVSGVKRAKGWATVGAVLAMMLTATACSQQGSDPGTPTPTVSRTAAASATAAAPPTRTPSPRATSTPTPTPSLTSTPAPAPPDGWAEFELSMQEAVDSYGVPGRYAVAVTDLQTGLTVSANGDQAQLAGCVVNFFVLLSAMLDVRDGLYGADVVDDLIAATLWSSNAQTAFELYGITGLGDVQAGVDKVQLVIKRLGLQSTIIDHPPAFGGAEDLTYVVESGDGETPKIEETADGNNWITALDANAALVALYDGSAIEEPFRTQLLEQMMEVKAGLNYLVAWVPYGTVSHKNGFFPNMDETWVDNDFGIVQVERGGERWAYVISFFSDSVPYKYGDIPLGQSLSLLAFDFFEQAYGP